MVLMSVLLKLYIFFSNILNVASLYPKVSSTSHIFDTLLSSSRVDLSVPYYTRALFIIKILPSACRQYMLIYRILILSNRDTFSFGFFFTETNKKVGLSMIGPHTCILIGVLIPPTNRCDVQVGRTGR